MAKIPHPSLDRFVAEPAELVEALAASGDRAALRADLTVRLREVLEEGWQVAREMLSRPRSGMAAAQHLGSSHWQPRQHLRSCWRRHHCPLRRRQLQLRTLPVWPPPGTPGQW